MVRIALISIESDVLSMMEREANTRGYEIVYKEHVRTDTLDRASADAFDAGAELVAACCHRPIQNVYMGVTVPVIYIKYKASELERNLVAACAENRCKPDETAFVTADLFLPGGLGQTRMQLPKIIRVNEAADIRAAVGEAVSRGCRLILGGGEVCSRASEMGVPNVVFTFGEGDIGRAFEAVSHEAEIIEIKNRCRHEMDAVMAGAACGLIVVNRRGAVIALNDHAAHLIGCAGKNVTGMYVLNIFQELEKDVLDRALDGGEQIYNRIVGSRRKRYTVGIEPVTENGEVVSCVISVQKVAADKTVAARDGGAEKREGGQLHSFSDFTYTSEAFRNVIKSAKFASYSDVPILLMGEEGTQMLELAQSIHRESSRYSKPFYEIECDAWREERIDEMLFGGGEIHDGKSLVAAAEGGTIFLNHVELLSKEVQFKVYKLITGYSARVDELRVVPADVRVIASTGKNLRELVSTGSFREDLYYALSIISISVPSLRARREDITCMVKAWTNSFSEIYSKPVFLSGGVYDCICEYMWPGNDRQLRHLCQKIVLTTPHRSVSEAFVRNEIEKLAKRELTEELPAPPRRLQSEAARIITALENNRGNKTKTAEELGISKTTLWRKIQKYGITEGYK